MHQHKDWKTYSKFAHTLISEKPQLEGILACGTDGEKALMDGFKRNLRFAMFLRCFLHFKDNIKRELTSRGLDEKVRKQFVEEIFGKQEENVKFYGLVDCNSEDEFETKLVVLKRGVGRKGKDVWIKAQLTIVVLQLVSKGKGMNKILKW